MTYDIRIDNATVVDGTGAPGYRGSVGIRDGRVVALNDLSGAAVEVIDGTGKIVSPGFIDIHTHYDAQIMWDRMLSVSPWHGVTTVLLGNCGFGIAPTRLEDRPLIISTLEKVEGMSRMALQEGLGDWNFESFPEYLDAILVVFDPAMVGAGKLRWTQDLPANEKRLIVNSNGIEAVIVNGVMLRDSSGYCIDTGVDLPGALLRGGISGAA